MCVCVCVCVCGLTGPTQGDDYGPHPLIQKPMTHRPRHLFFLNLYSYHNTLTEKQISRPFSGLSHERSSRYLFLKTLFQRSPGVLSPHKFVHAILYHELSPGDFAIFTKTLISPGVLVFSVNRCITTQRLRNRYESMWVIPDGQPRASELASSRAPLAQHSQASRGSSQMDSRERARSRASERASELRLRNTLRPRRQWLTQCYIARTVPCLGRRARQPH